MIFLPIDTGANAVPQTIVDAIALNDRFEGIRDTLGIGGYYGMGWLPVGTAFEYHSANSIKTTSDVDLTSLLQEGDKITWEHGTTGGDRFGWISFVDYDDTVANRTYIEIIGDEVLDEAVVADSVGISRIANPFGFPQDPDFGQITAKTGGASQVSPSENVWYNLGGSISIPRGRWLLAYSTNAAGTRGDVSATGTYIVDLRLGLSTSSSGDPSSFANGFSFGRVSQDIRFSSNTITRNSASTEVGRSATYTATSAQTIYLNASSARSDASSITLGGTSSSFITATPAYK